VFFVKLAPKIHCHIVKNTLLQTAFSANCTQSMIGSEKWFDCLYREPMYQLIGK